jgi:hypothetical protein
MIEGTKEVRMVSGDRVLQYYIEYLIFDSRPPGRGGAAVVSQFPNPASSNQQLQQEDLPAWQKYVRVDPQFY